MGLRKTQGVAREKLLVRKRFDGIKTGSAKCGNRGTQGSPEQGQKNGAEDPARREEDGEAGIGLLEDGLGEESDGDACETPGDGEEIRLAEKHLDDIEAGEAQRLENADFAGAFQDHG